MFKITSGILLLTTLFFGFTSYLFISDSITQEDQLDCAHELVRIFHTIIADPETTSEIDFLHSWLQEDSLGFTKISENALKSECTLVSYSDTGSLLEVQSEIGMIGPTEIPSFYFFEWEN